MVLWLNSRCFALSFAIVCYRLCMSLFYEGFELKRRGELQLTKAFQSQIFEKFLEGY
ncbi:hypothetical protein Zmor_016308, partial [Zophobas morio]